MSNGITISSYLAWITPKRGDPTHSVLRAHLLIEQLFDVFFHTKLAHADALLGARFTFAQKLAIAKALSDSISPSDWRWQAVARLNKIRNSLAHSPGPKLGADLQGYVDFCLKHSKTPLPSQDTKNRDEHGVHSNDQPLYTHIDLITLGLYIELACQLGFDIRDFASKDAFN